MLYDLVTSSEFFFIASHAFALGFILAYYLMRIRIKQLRSKLNSVSKELIKQYEYNSQQLTNEKTEVVRMKTA